MQTCRDYRSLQLLQGLLLLSLVFGQYNCSHPGGSGGHRDPVETRVDSAVMAIDKPPTRDSTAAQGRQDAPTFARSRPAYLGYAYPPRIHRKETRMFYAYVTVVHDEVLIKTRLRTDASTTEGKDAADDTIILYPKDISIYRSIHLSLTDPAADFKITPVQFSDTQSVDSYRGTRWQWNLYTETDKKTARLFLKAHGLRSEGAPDDLDNRVIPISIVIQSNVFRTIMVYLYDHPAVSVPAIIAFLGFMAWLIKRFLSKGKKED